MSYHFLIENGNNSANKNVTRNFFKISQIQNTFVGHVFTPDRIYAYYNDKALVKHSVATAYSI